MTMNKRALALAIAALLVASTSVAGVCEYIPGKTKFIDYAKCRYGADSIVVVNLPKDSCWDCCVYHVEMFCPEKLLAVTKERNGQEELSINKRGEIGNPCYLSKQKCDAALKAFKEGLH
jgi:hypothetical protein